MSLQRFGLSFQNKFEMTVGVFTLPSSLNGYGMHTEEKCANQFEDQNVSFMDITFTAPRKFGNKSSF